MWDSLSPGVTADLIAATVGRVVAASARSGELVLIDPAGTERPMCSPTGGVTCGAWPPIRTRAVSSPWTAPGGCGPTSLAPRSRCPTCASAP